jgi:molybdopterin synthase sulfur carrier subunit
MWLPGEAGRMDIECVCFGPVRETVGTKTVVQTLEEGATVGDLLTALARDLDGFRKAALTDDDELREEMVVTVDTTNIRQLDGTATTLTDGDTVRITPQIRGGGSVAADATDEGGMWRRSVPDQMPCGCTVARYASPDSWAAYASSASSNVVLKLKSFRNGTSSAS